MQVRNNNTTFGAIKINAPKKELKKLPEIAKQIGSTGKIAENYWGKQYGVIESRPNTSRENELLTKLKNIFKDNKKIKITSISNDENLQENIERFSDLRYGSKHFDNPISIKNIHNNIANWIGL